MDVVLKGMQLQAMLIVLWSPDITSTASVGQQLANRHFGCEFLVWVVRQIFKQRIVERDFSRLHLLHHCDSREHLAHGCKGKACREVVGCVVFPIIRPLVLSKDWLAFLRN